MKQGCVNKYIKVVCKSRSVEGGFEKYDADHIGDVVKGFEVKST